MEVSKTFDVVATCTIGDVLTALDIKEQRLCIDINGEYKETLNETDQLNVGDKITISPEFRGGDGGGTKVITSVISIAALVAASAIVPGVGSAGLTALQAAGLKTAVLVGSTLLIGGIIALNRPDQDTKNDENSTNRPDYSLTTGSNGVRINGPLPIIMGQMRVFPDLSAKPYNEYRYADTNIFHAFGWVKNPFTAVSTAFTLSSSIIVGGVTFNYDYVNYGGSSIDDFARFGDTDSYHPTREDAETTPDPIAGTSYVGFTLVYVTSNSAADPSFINVFVPYIDLRQNGLSATPLPEIILGSANYIRYLYDESVSSLVLLNEVVKETLNYGYGDLLISDSKIAATDSNDYRNFDSQLSSANANINNWPLIQGETSFDIFSGNITVEYFEYVNGHVDTIDGGLLSNSADFAWPDNWVIRQGPEKNSTFAIQLDIEGRILRSDPVNGGVQSISREFQFQYREIGGSWTDFSNAMIAVDFTPFIINSVSMNNLYRETLYVDGLSPSNYEIRARKIDLDEEDKDNVCEIYLKRVRFYQEDEDYPYPAQNRQAIIINSSQQIYGTLDRLSSLVSAKAWAYNGTDYDWNFTSNPADWFLYFARGGFLNTSADGSFAYPFSPTVGWVNSADHPDNGERLFGAGKEDSQIDFDSLQAWWQFCVDKNLSFNAVLDSKRNPLEVLYDIAAAGRGSVTYTNGKIGVVWEDANQPTVAVFTPDNIIKDSFRINYLNQKVTDKIIGQYIDADQKFSAQNVEAVVPGVTNPTEETTLTLWGTTNEDQAQRTVNLLAAQQLYRKRNVEFSSDAEGMMLSRGDVITLSHDVSQWGYSGRILDLEYNATNIISFRISCEIDSSVTNIFIRNTHNEINNYSVSIVSGRVVLVTPWLLQDAPYYLDSTGTINAISNYPETYPEDFIALGGNVALPGKKLRIFEIKADNMNRFSFLCIDEENAMYAHEYDTTYVAPENVERIKARVFNGGFIKKQSGEGFITWDRDGCQAVSILISVNGGAYVPYIDNQSATIYSNQANIFYADGTTITVIISPVVVDVPFESISETVSFTV
jgi:predicted phage tail protein